MKKKGKNKVGRPKLASQGLKKSTTIMLVVSMVAVLMLVIGGLFNLNIIKVSKLKGTAYKYYNLGDKFCLGTECFFVLEDDGDSVKAMAEYNLLVGSNSQVDDDFNVLTEEQIPESEEG